MTDLWDLFTSAPARNRTIAQIFAAEPQAAGLFSDLGYDPALRETADSILAEMRSLVCVRISNFSALRNAIKAVANRPEIAAKHLEVRHRELFEAVLAAGDDEAAVLAILNADPVHSQIPFVEQMPVERNGETIWVTPIEHTHIQKPARDPARFEDLVERLRKLYATAHPARREQPRLNILDALTRLQRELKREKPYLAAALQLLEAKNAAYEAESIDPQPKAAAQSLRAILLACDRIEVECRFKWFHQVPVASLRREAAAITSLYLDHPRLHRRWLTSHILSALLATARFDILWWPNLGWPNLGWSNFSVCKLVALIRNELRTGSYDAVEMTARIRKLESKGLYVSSLAFPLLQLPEQARKAPAY